MKILYITPTLSGEGGLVRVLALKANYLSAVKGYEVHILTQNTDNAPLFYDFDAKIIRHDMILKGNRIQFLRNYKNAINHVIQQINPDIIMVCDGLKGFFVPWIINTDIPIVFETHGSIFNLEKPGSNPVVTKFRFQLLNYLKRKAAGKFDRFIVLSEEAKKEWNLKNSQIIPNPNWFEEHKRASLKNKKAIAVCRHSYEKGVDRLLLIWQKVIQIYPDWELDIYGSSEGKKTFHKLAADLGISNEVHFLEPVRNIQEQYIDASLFLMCSRTEGFPMALIEAMDCGLPCVAYDCPCGPRAIITNKENGFLVKDNDSDEFLKIVIQLIVDKELAVNIGNNAAAAVKKYNRNEIMETWETLFTTLTANKNS